MGEDRLKAAVETIKAELDERLMQLRRLGKLLEAQRLAARTKYDLEMLQETGMCRGVENYSRHLNGTAPGSTPFTLIDYFPKDYLLIIDESHATLPQVHAMYGGDSGCRARSTTGRSSSRSSRTSGTRCSSSARRRGRGS